MGACVPISFMPSDPTPPVPEIEANQQMQDAQYYRRILHRMIDRGDAMAEMIHQEAKARVEAAAPDATHSPAADAAIALDRVARMVRRCILLARKVSEPVPIRAAVEAGRRIAARKAIIRQVEDAIHCEAGAYEADALHAELLERLDAPEFADELGRPVADIVTEIRADLGLGADSFRHWKRRTPRDIALLYARAAAPSRAPVSRLVQVDKAIPRCRGRP
jgi:hypothetical protein